MKTNFIVDLGLFPFQVMFSIGETPEELKASLLGTNIGMPSDDQVAMMINKHGRTSFYEGYTIITISDYDGGPADIGLLSHEIFHAVRFILGYIPIPLNKTTEEVYAYAIQSLMVEATNELNNILNEDQK